MADIKQKWPWPHNVGVLGTFPEEMRARPKLEKNPDAAPMPELAPTRLLAPKFSSDNLRIGEPRVGEVDFANATELPLTHVVLRRVLMRRRKRGWALFGEAAEAESLEDVPANRRDQMRSLLSREEAMLQLLSRYNELAEQVYARLLSEAKG